MRDARITLADGRALAYTDIAESGRTCVFFFHGAPMSRLHLLPYEAQFAARGLRVVSPDRPGYGRSSPQPRRSMADWPVDVAALADALGVERFIVAGHSSGGPYPVACAALLADRVLGAAVIGGVTDFGWPGAWDEYVDSERQIMRQPDEGAAVAWCVERYGPDGSRFHDASDFQFGAPDQALFADAEAGASLMLAAAEAFRQGVGGYAQDVFVQGRPWPFDPGRIAVPVIVAHGDADTAVPFAHSRRTSELIPGASLRTLRGHGHLTILSELPALVMEFAHGA